MYPGSVFTALREKHVHLYPLRMTIKAHLQVTLRNSISSGGLWGRHFAGPGFYILFRTIISSLVELRGFDLIVRMLGVPL